MSKIRGNTQLLAGSLYDEQISATAAIALSKLADGLELIKRDGSVAFTGNLNAGTHKLTGLAAATADSDAATWGQVQAVAQSLQLKAAVRVATVTAGNVNIATGGLLTIDGVQLVAGDRVLLKNQTAPAQNGIYSAAAGTWVRSEDADGLPDPNNEVKPGMFTFVSEGAVNADTGWVLATNGVIAIGTTELNFVQFSAAGVLVSGAGLEKVGNSLAVVVKEGVEIDGGALRVKVDGESLAQSVDGVKVADLGVTNEMLAGSIATAKLEDGAELFQRDGSVAMTGPVNAGSQQINLLAAGALATDAVNKGQLDAAIDGVDVTAQIAPIEAEIDAIEAGAGLEADGTYAALEGSNYLDEATSLKNADSLLDAQVKLNAEAIVALGTTAGEGTGAVQAELDATQVGAGLEADGAYVADATTNYLAAATSLTDADKKLDAQVKLLADEVGAFAELVTDEIDATQVGAGLATNGAYVAVVGSNYLDASTSLSNADSLLDVQVKLNAEAITALSDATGEGTGAVQAELDVTQTGAGLAADGTYVAVVGSNYLDASTSLSNADSLLDIQVQLNANKGVSLQAELDVTQTGAGLSATGAYVADATTNYLAAATSLTNADKKLDAQVKLLADGKFDKTAVNTDSTFASAVDTEVPSALAVKTYLSSQVADNAVGFVDAEVPTGAIDGSNVNFTLAGIATPADSVHVFVNGLRTAVVSVTPGASDTAFVMTSAPQIGDVITSDYRI